VLSSITALLAAGMSVRLYSTEKMWYFRIDAPAGDFPETPISLRASVPGPG
jgi:hypothetical protein